MKASWLEALPNDLLFHCVRDLYRLVALSRASKAMRARLVGAASACGATLAAPNLDVALAIGNESTFRIGELVLIEKVSVYDVEMCMDWFMNLYCCDAFKSLHTVRVPGHLARELKHAYLEETLAGKWAREKWHVPARSGGFRVIATHVAVSKRCA